jgi:hypothetical protein
MRAADNGGYRSGGPEDNILCRWESSYGRFEGQCYTLRHEASTVWTKSILVFWNLVLCNDVDRFRRFGRTYSLQMKDSEFLGEMGSTQSPKAKVLRSFETSGSNTANIPS